MSTQQYYSNLLEETISVATAVTITTGDAPT